MRRSPARVSPVRWATSVMVWAGASALKLRMTAKPPAKDCTSPSPSTIFAVSLVLSVMREDYRAESSAGSGLPTAQKLHQLAQGGVFFFQGGLAFRGGPIVKAFAGFHAQVPLANLVA